MKFLEEFWHELKGVSLFIACAFGFHTMSWRPDWRWNSQKGYELHIMGRCTRAHCYHRQESKTDAKP